MSADARVRELLRRLQDGGVSPDEVCRDCPDLLHEVRERWSKLRAFESRLDAVFPGDADDDDADDPSGPPPAPVFPDYEVAEPLGSGGMGVVYKARERTSGQIVALKVIHPHLRRVPGFVERLVREAEIGSQIVHDNVVRTLGLAPDASRALSRQALVTEYVEGQTLRALLAEMGRVPEQLCRHVGREIARGLAAIHAGGAVHRDLKPENVLITRDNVVKVMDLGVARLLDAAGDLTHSFVGSLRYAAPEQVRGGTALDGRADLYALGLTLYELSTGRHPLDFGDAPLRRAGELNPQLSALLEEVLAKLLEPERERRFAIATHVADILEQGEQSDWWRERSNAIRRATRNAPRRIRPPRETALHGREAELSLLRLGFTCAANGDGRVILVQGEAGIGKSRLLDEFVAQLQPQDVHVLFGGYAPGGAATPSGAFASAYREFLGDEDMTSALRGLLPQNAALVPAFAALLRGEPPPGGADPVTKDALQTAFTRTTQSLAAERPTVVVIEDLHLATEEGRALFAALALAVSGHRVLLVGTARRTLDRRWGADLCRHSQASRISLRRLGRSDLTALLRDALRSAGTAEELAPRIEEKSDGNPYFVFELVRGLRETGLLERSADGTWSAARAKLEIRSPSSITEFIAARIADLLPEDREILEVAACCGFEFDPLLLGDTLGLERLPLLRRLGTLESARHLVRSAGRRYLFDHHQIQEVVYAGLSQVHRETLHAAIAASLERRSGAAGRLPEELDGALCADLASHYLCAARGTSALRYLDAAVDHLTRGARNEDAARLLDLALAEAGLLGGARRCESLLRTARCHQLAGNPSAQTRALHEAMDLADAVGEAGQRARVRDSLGVALHRASRHHEALEVLVQAVSLHRQNGDSNGESRVTTSIGTVLSVLGRYDEAIDHQRRGAELAREAGSRTNEAWAICGLGSLLLMLGRHEEARVQLERSAALCREAGDTNTAGRVAVNLGNVHWTAGRFAEAQAEYERYLAHSVEVGDRTAEARATGNLGYVLKSLGRFADSKVYGERCLALTRECGSRIDEAIATVNQGALLASLGRSTEARMCFESTLQMARELASKKAEACALGYQGEQLSNAGHDDEAIPLHERQVALSREIGDRDAEAAALMCLGSAHAEAGHAVDAATHLDAAISMARELDIPATLVVVSAERARLPGGDPDAAARLLDELAARVDVADRMRARWVLWRATHVPEHLADANRLLDYLVEHAPPDCHASMVENVRLCRSIRAAASAPPSG